MVSFGGSFQNKQFSRRSLGANKLSRRGARIGNSTSRFGGSTSNTGAGCDNGQSDVNQKGGMGANKYRQNTPWSKSAGSSGWGATFNKAIFGDRKSRQLRKEEIKNAKLDKTKTKINRGWRDGKLPEELLGAEIKVDRKVKSGDVKYNYRKNIISISETDGLKKKELPKQIIELAKSGRFRDTTGVGKVTSQKKRMIKNMLRHKNIAINKANRELLSSATKRSRTKSSHRKLKLGKLVNKKYKF